MLQQEHSYRRRRPHGGHSEPHASRAQCESGRAHGRTDQDARGLGAHRTGKPAGRLHRARPEPHDRAPDGGARQLSGNQPLHRKDHLENRGCRARRS